MAIKVIARGSDTCALFANGAVMCWGLNSDGQVGDQHSIVDWTVPHRVRDLGPAIDIAVGGTYACALVYDGTVWCWGVSEVVTAVRPTRLTSIEDVARLDTWGLSCSVLDNGGVSCWGDNSVGQLGIAASWSKTGPAPVVGVHDVVDLGVSPGMGCALMPDGTARCWGWSDTGLFIDDGVTVQPVATELPGLNDLAQIAPGIADACARKKNGQVLCWGANEHGVLGDGTVAPHAQPQAVSGLDDADQVVVQEYVTCARRRDGSLWCWGERDDGMLGDGKSFGQYPPQLVPQKVPDLDGVVDVSIGILHVCALRDDHAIFCWGTNSNGQLGDGTLEDRNTPTLVKLPTSEGG